MGIARTTDHTPPGGADPAQPTEESDMDVHEIQIFLEQHRQWLANDPSGKRANLTGAYLEDANLTDANLTGANLTGAYLVGALFRLGWKIVRQ